MVPTFSQRMKRLKLRPSQVNENRPSCLTRCLETRPTLITMVSLLILTAAVAVATTDRFVSLDVDGTLAGKTPPPPPIQTFVSFNSSFGNDMVLQQVSSLVHSICVVEWPPSSHIPLCTLQKEDTCGDGDGAIPCIDVLDWFVDVGCTSMLRDLTPHFRFFVVTKSR